MQETWTCLHSWAEGCLLALCRLPTWQASLCSDLGGGPASHTIPSTWLLVHRPRWLSWKCTATGFRTPLPVH